jgi:hypothetical protein
MERAWMLTSIVGLIAAAILFFREYPNAAFVAGTLGAVAWFLSYRTKLRTTLPEMAETTETQDDASENQDDDE